MLVQETIDRASKGRTTIVVSHRMSAIKNADRIVFISKGQVLEDGTHDELIALNGHYFEMVKSTHHEIKEAEPALVDNTIEKIPDGKYDNPKIDASDEKLEENGDPNEQSSVTFWESFRRILQTIRPDGNFLFIAIGSSIVLGLIQPLFKIVFTEMFAVS